MNEGAVTVSRAFIFLKQLFHYTLALLAGGPFRGLADALRSHIRRIGTILGAGGAIATVAVAVAGAGAAAAPNVKVIAKGLNSPKHLLYTTKGVYVVESGLGGKKGGATCVSGPATGGPGMTTYCEGPTGAVALISGKHVKVAVTKSGHLAVLYPIGTGWGAAPSSVSRGDGSEHVCH